MSKTSPEEWTSQDKSIISANNTIHDKNNLPKKLAFGSAYFYGEPSILYSNIDEANNPLPPFSLARGGFSVGWGASVLPAHDCDLQDWPIQSIDLQKYYEEVLSELPLSAEHDELSEFFPLHTDKFDSLKLTTGNTQLLSAFKKNIDKLKNMNAVAGKARLLTGVSDSAKGGVNIAVIA